MTLEFDYVNQEVTNLFEAIGLALPGSWPGWSLSSCSWWRRW